MGAAVDELRRILEGAHTLNVSQADGLGNGASGVPFDESRLLSKAGSFAIECAIQPILSPRSSAPTETSTLVSSSIRRLSSIALSESSPRLFNGRPRR